jgi:ATP-dependent helicase YprA (DUF1998 family)
MLGFPYSLPSFVSVYVLQSQKRCSCSPQRQQSGRAGRRARDALTVLVLEQDSKDAYYSEYPDELFDGGRANILPLLQVLIRPLQ